MPVLAVRLRAIAELVAGPPGHLHLRSTSCRIRMARGAIVGRADVALATFIGTFYAAQMRRTTDTTEAYRFSCPTESLAVLGRLYSSLNAGEFPATPAPEEFARVRFSMDYPDKLAKRLLPGFGKGKRDRNLPELELGAAALADDPRGDGPGPVEGASQALTESQVFVLLAELPSLEAAGPLAIDGPLASIIRYARDPKTAVVWWLPGPPPPGKAEEGEDPPPAIPPPDAGTARSKFSSALLEQSLPATSKVGHQPVSFFAWVATEKKGGALRIQRRQVSKVGGFEPEYPYDEAIALIDHLGVLSA